MKKLRRILLWTLGVFVALAVVGSFVEDPEESTMPETAMAPQYQFVGGVEDLSYATVKRFARKATIPRGLEEAELTAQLEAAVLELERSAPDGKAFAVHVYREGDPTSGGFSAGQATRAPNGRWEDAPTGGALQTVVEINPLYFAPPIAGPAVGDTVTLARENGGSIYLSREYGAWTDDLIVREVSSGTAAVVLERRSQPMTDREFVRYRVRLQGGTEGWVHSHDLAGEGG